MKDVVYARFRYGISGNEGYPSVDGQVERLTIVSLATNAAGSVKATCTVLMTPEEVDQAVALAAEKGAAYRPPAH